MKVGKSNIVWLINEIIWAQFGGSLPEGNTFGNANEVNTPKLNLQSLPKI